MVAFILGLSIGVMMDFVLKGLKWVCEKSVDLYFDWKERKTKKKERIYKQPIVGETLKPKVGPGSYATGGEMEPAQKERMREHFVEPATGYNEPAPTQKSKLLFYQGWRICSHKTSTLEHPDGRLMKVDTATLWEIRELSRVEREMREQLAMRAPVGNYTDAIKPVPKFDLGTDIPKGEPMFWDGSKLTDMPKDLSKGDPVISEAEGRRIIISLGGTSPEIEHLRSTMDQEHVDSSRAWLMRQFNRGRKFSPFSNPLGDTAAFMKRADNAAFPPYPYTAVSFRHRKGGHHG
jgi:hypothetical protein